MNVYRFEIVHPRTKKSSGPYQTALDYLNEDVRQLIEEYIMPLRDKILFLHEDAEHITPQLYITEYMPEKYQKFCWLQEAESKNKNGRPLSAFGSFEQMESWFNLTEIYIMLCFGFHLVEYEIEDNDNLILKCYIYPDDRYGQLLFCENLTKHKYDMTAFERNYVKNFEEEHPEYKGLYDLCMDCLN